MAHAQQRPVSQTTEKRKSLAKRLFENRLGEILMDNGIITGEDLHEALLEQAETKDPIGTILIRHGVINQRILETTLQRQMYKKFSFILFLWVMCMFC